MRTMDGCVRCETWRAEIESVAMSGSASKAHLSPGLTTHRSGMRAAAPGTVWSGSGAISEKYLHPVYSIHRLQLWNVPAMNSMHLARLGLRIRGR